MSWGWTLAIVGILAALGASIALVIVYVPTDKQKPADTLRTQPQEAAAAQVAAKAAAAKASKLAKRTLVRPEVHMTELSTKTEELMGIYALLEAHMRADVTGRACVLGLFGAATQDTDTLAIHPTSARIVSLWRRDALGPNKWGDVFRGVAVSDIDLLGADLAPGADRLLTFSARTITVYRWAAVDDVGAIGLLEDSTEGALCGALAQVRFDDADRTQFYAIDNGLLAHFDGDDWAVLDTDAVAFNQCGDWIVVVGTDALRFYHRVADAWALQASRALALTVRNAWVDATGTRLLLDVPPTSETYLASYSTYSFATGAWVQVSGGGAKKPVRGHYFGRAGVHLDAAIGTDASIALDAHDLGGSVAVFGEDWELDGCVAHDSAGNYDCSTVAYTVGRYSVDTRGQTRINVYRRPLALV